MNYFLYILLFTTSIFSNTVSDTIAVENKIIIPEINIYGGLDENSISTNIDVIENHEFNLHKHFCACK